MGEGDADAYYNKQACEKQGHDFWYKSDLRFCKRCGLQTVVYNKQEVINAISILR